jgi:uncharacterized ubiquitin-like protein YukD
MISTQSTLLVTKMTSQKIIKIKNKMQVLVSSSKLDATEVKGGT